MAVIQFSQYAKNKKRPSQVESSTAVHELVSALFNIKRNCDEIKKCNKALWEALLLVPRGNTIKFGKLDVDPRIVWEVVDFFANKNLIEVESILKQSSSIGDSRVGNHL